MVSALAPAPYRCVRPRTRITARTYREPGRAANRPARCPHSLDNSVPGLGLMGTNAGKRAHASPVIGAIAGKRAYRVPSATAGPALLLGGERSPGAAAGAAVRPRRHARRLRLPARA